MKNEPELIYPGKIKPEEILKSAAGFNIIIDKKFITVRDINGWSNLLCNCDNFLFLKNICSGNGNMPALKGEVKLIYIDPPFGTGNEYRGNKGQNGYSAKSKGAEFIESIRQSVILAREVLSDKGFIFVRQAYNYGHYIKVMLDEVFGIDNFKNEIIISRKRQSMGTGGKFEIQNESLFVYSKIPESKLKAIYAKRSLVNFKWTGFLKQEVRNPRERIFFGKTLFPPDGQHFSLVQGKVDKLLKEHYLRLKCRNCRAIYYFDIDETGDEFYSKKRTREKFKYLDLTSDDNVFGVTHLETCLKCSGENFIVEYLPSDDLKINNLWLDIPSYTNASGYPSENSEELLKRVIECSTEEGEIVMDFFGGSGTTMIMAEKLNRRWVYCDFGKLAQSVFIKRLFLLNEQHTIKNFRIFSQSSVKLSGNRGEKFSVNCPPDIEAGIIAVGTEMKLIIKKFLSTQVSNHSSCCAFLLIDKNYNGSEFNIEEFIDGNNLSNEINIGNIDEFGEKAAISFYDIHGNQATRVFTIN